MIKANMFVAQAESGGYIGIPYTRLDCQALVEKVLKDCGLSRNWRGSNDMWRNAVHSQTEISEVDSIPPGAWLFTIKHDGREDKSRYKDGINAAHVGIYLGGGCVIHSTTGGVQWDNVTSSRWTHYALANDIDYTEQLTLEEMVTALYNKFIKEV